jgi:hypothetical protein
MQLIRLAVLALALAPVSVSAAVMLAIDPQQAGPPPCYSDSPACDRSVTAPLREGSMAIGLPDPAVAAIIGLAIVGVALGRRRSGLPEVVS